MLHKVKLPNKVKIKNEKLKALIICSIICL